MAHNDTKAQPPSRKQRRALVALATTGCALLGLLAYEVLRPSDNDIPHKNLVLLESNETTSPRLSNQLRTQLLTQAALQDHPKISDMKQKLASLQSTNKDLAAHNKLLGEDIEEQKRRYSSIVESSTRIQDEFRQLREEWTSMQSANRNLLEQNKQLAANLTDYEERYITLIDHSTGLQDTSQQLHEELFQRRDDQCRLEQELHNVRNDFSQLHRERKMTSNDNVKLTAIIEQLQKELQSLQQAYVSLNEEIDALTEDDVSDPLVGTWTPWNSSWYVNHSVVMKHPTTAATLSLLQASGDPHHHAAALHEELMTAQVSLSALEATVNRLLKEIEVLQQHLLKQQQASTLSVHHDSLKQLALLSKPSLSSAATHEEIAENQDADEDEDDIDLPWDEDNDNPAWDDDGERGFFDDDEENDLYSEGEIDTSSAQNELSHDLEILLATPEEDVLEEEEDNAFGEENEGDDDDFNLDDEDEGVDEAEDEGEAVKF